MSKFCPECGRLETKNQPLVKGLCRTCFLKNNPVLEGYKELKIVICPRCQSYLYQNKWHKRFSNQDDVNLKKIISRILPERLKLQPGAKINNLGIVIEDNQDGKKINVKLILNSSVYNTKSKDTHFLEITKEQSICNLCRKKSSSYYEAKIQIRPRNESMLRLIKNCINENNIGVSAETEKEFGYDLYLTNKKDISKITSIVKKKFEIEVKISRTLYGRKDGREVYRTTALLRLKG